MTTTTSTWLKTVAAAIVFASTAPSALAGVIFSPGVAPAAGTVSSIRYALPGTVNGPAHTVTGRAGAAVKLVDFSGTDLLITDDDPSSPPPPLVRSTDGTLSDMTIRMQDGGFTTFYFNLFMPFISRNPAGRYADISVLAYGGAVETFTQSLRNGNNLLTMTATGNTVLRSISISTPFDISDVRQSRIGGMQAVPVSEPATAWIVGLGLLGFLTANSRRRSGR